MTETEWLTAITFDHMAVELGPHWERLSGREKWLFATACCRRVWHLMHDDRSRRTIEVRERYADGLVTNAELEDAIGAAALARNEAKAFLRDRDLSEPFDQYGAEFGPVWAAAAAATNWITAVAFSANAASCGPAAERRATLASERAAQCGLLRDVVGNPFRPVEVDPDWRTEAVVALARAIYDDRAFDRLPVLADALDDAGCDNADLLGHLRNPALTHVRGCWAVDLLLGLS